MAEVCNWSVEGYRGGNKQSQFISVKYMYNAIMYNEYEIYKMAKL